MYQALSDGFTPVRTVLDKAVYECGFEYHIREVHIVRDRDGSFYVRSYYNEVSMGANGRPDLQIKEEYVPVEDPDSITEDTWLRHCLFCNERIVTLERNEVTVDAEALKYAQQAMKGRKVGEENG